jgi:serine/threonine protein kinase
MLEKTLQDRYKILKPLGSGGFSSTFLAIDQQQPDGPKCVIKQLEPQFTDSVNLQLARRLFKTEAKVLHKLGTHPQIPQLFDHFEENQEFYLVQEFIDGHDLTDEFTPGKQWSEPDAICLLQEILETLAFVHQQNVIHRDIKPSNLIRRHSDYKLVLIDFGAVKQIGTQTIMASGMAPLTIAIGTPGYLPTEQASGMPKFNSDIYAVGMIGISALTGLSPTRQELPIDPETEEIRWSHLTEVTPELADIIDKMVRYDYRTRYQSAVAVLNDLKNLQERLTEVTVPLSGLTVPLNIQNLSAATEASAPLNQLQDSINPQVSSPTAQVNTQDLPTRVEAPATVSQPQDSTGVQAHTVPQVNTPDLSTTAQTNTPLSRPTDSTSAQAHTVAQVNTPDLSTTAQTNTPLSQPQDSRSSSVPPTVVGATRPVVRRWPIKTAILISVVGGGALFGFSRFFTSPNVVSKSPVSQSASVLSPQATSQNPQATELLSKADKLRESQKYQEALPVYEQALQLDSKAKSAAWGQCYVLNVLQRYEDAIKACDRALSIEQNYPEALSSKGYALNALKRYQDALNVYEQAIKQKPDYFEAWVNKGAALYNMERYDEALAAYEKVLTFKPNYPEAWNNKGTALAALKKYQEAIEAYDKALETKQDYPEAWNNRGIALEKMQRNKEALTSYEKAIQQQPDYSIAKENRQRVLQSLKQ